MAFENQQNIINQMQNFKSQDARLKGIRHNFEEKTLKRIFLINFNIKIHNFLQKR